MNPDWSSQLDAFIDANTERIVALRRHLHAHPEPSNEELETSLHLYKLFDEMGLPVRMGPEGRGVVVDSHPGAHPGDVRLIALRADVDGLRIHDLKHVEYRSQNPGIMHACGHDAHTACVFGALSAIHELERQALLPVPLAWRGIFQPAEETSSGAREMIAAGFLQDVEAIFGLHVDPTQATGRIAVRPGVFTAYCDEMHVFVHGRGGHGARPHLSNDPIAAASQLIGTLYQFVPRGTDSQEAVVVSIGKIRGGESSNVIPEQVEFWGTLRTLDGNVRQQAIQRIRTLASGVDQITGTHTEVRFETSIPSVYNDPALTELASRVTDKLLGPDALRLLPRPSMGSEDFAAYLEHVPGVMFRLGCAGEEGDAPGLHTPTFDVDERCLIIGAKILAKMVVECALSNTTQTTNSQFQTEHNR